MAFAAVVSLVQTLKQLLPCDPDPNSHIASLQEKLTSLQAHLAEVSPVQNSSLDELEIQIRTAAYEAQDIIEMFISRQTLGSESEENIQGGLQKIIQEAERNADEITGSQTSPSVLDFIRDLQEITKKVDSMRQAADKIAGSIARTEEVQTGYSFHEEASYNTALYTTENNNIVGPEKDRSLVTEKLISTTNSREVVPVFGMTGIGKTTLAKSIYKDSRVKTHFESRAWVTVSRGYRVGDIFLKLLGSMETKGQKSDISGSKNKLSDRTREKIYELLGGGKSIQKNNATDDKLGGEEVSQKNDALLDGDEVSREEKAALLYAEEVSKRKAPKVRKRKAAKVSKKKAAPLDAEEEIENKAALSDAEEDIEKKAAPLDAEEDIENKAAPSDAKEDIEKKAALLCEEVCQKIDALIGGDEESQKIDAIKGLLTGDTEMEKIVSLLGLDLYQKLSNTRYLIVIDDMWEEKVWDSVKQYLCDDNKGSRVLLTTRLSEVADYAKSSVVPHKMEPLNDTDSWTLLCQTVFQHGPCPPYLELTGRKIATNCGGVPPSITMIGGLLKVETAQEYWKIIAEDTNSALAKSGDESYKEISSLSYNHLPGRLSGCFLYMGAFPKDSKIPVSKLLQLWVAEGFIPPSRHESLEQVAEGYLEELVGRNLISVEKRSFDGQIMTCCMDGRLWELAVNISQKEEFFHAVSHCDEEVSEGIQRQRRLAIDKNILASMKYMYDFTLRTLLYVGQHRHHPRRFCLTFHLLRVLDALAVYFIAFPPEIVELIHLRYLSMTYNGQLPPTVSKLRNLQILIVLSRNPKIILPGAPILPLEIWNMPQLRHILFTRTCLPGLSGLENSLLFANLQTLSNVNAACLTKEVLQNIRNLKKLGIWIEPPGVLELKLDEALQQLEVLKLTVLKLNFQQELALPKTLTKLSPRGCRIPWKDMPIVGKLPHLQVLKLREFAFQGPEWDPNEMEFRSLKFLLLECLDLQRWSGDHTHFPELERLTIRHCYELEGLNPEIGDIGCLKLIEVVHCSPYAVGWAEYIQQENEDAGIKTQVRIHASWN